VKDAAGARSLWRFVFEVTLTCEDLTTFDLTITYISEKRLGANGRFRIRLTDPYTYFDVEGSIRWGKGEGTAIVNIPRITEDGQGAQLCTTGDLTWTIDRDSSHPHGTSRSLGVGVLEVRERHGVTEVVKLYEPA
jgi:hypothetical protein